METKIESALHWEKLADQAKNQAAWDREHGIDLSLPGQSPGDHKARTYLQQARLLRAEAASGEEYCMCHEKPRRICPDGAQIRRANGIPDPKVQP